MSSDDSITTASTDNSSLKQFGLYKTIDARTEEFLRLSKKKQIRQGCACAAVSTAITVAVIIIILLIYEYAIAVKQKQIERNDIYYEDNIKNDMNKTMDVPIANRLDRSYFGFDQDYYERMPLLVNALQENSHVDPVIDMSLPTNKRGKATNIDNLKTDLSKLKYITTPIRRTSPRPFIFEYRDPTPLPFSKTYSSRNWIDSYRNAQRLKNLQQIIGYLEKTINAKFGDIYTIPTSTHMAFSGVYVQPVTNKIPQIQPISPAINLFLRSTNKIENNNQSNHQSDPLFTFKPESPGDVNMLADSLFRFSPLPATTFVKNAKVPMFRPISHNRNCDGIKCDKLKTTPHFLEETKNKAFPPIDKPESFSVLLKLFPVKGNPNYNKHVSLQNGQSSSDTVYFTTMTPIHFIRKTNFPMRRHFVRQMQPNNIMFKKTLENILAKDFIPSKQIHDGISDTAAKTVVHVNAYPQNLIAKSNVVMAEATTQFNNHRILTEHPMLLSTHVEDYHIGSSGIIPIETRTTPSIPTVSAVIPFFETTTELSDNKWSTEPPEILKFSREDAKIPEENRKSRYSENRGNEENGISMREFMDSMETVKVESEGETPIAKLKNDIEVTTQNIERFSKEDTKTTTIKTYVPQINGHYRSINQNSKNINSWLDNDSENRRKKLEMSILNLHEATNVPYTVIKRNNTKNSDGETNIAYNLY